MYLQKKYPLPCHLALARGLNERWRNSKPLAHTRGPLLFKVIHQSDFIVSPLTLSNILHELSLVFSVCGHVNTFALMSKRRRLLIFRLRFWHWNFHLWLGYCYLCDSVMSWPLKRQALGSRCENTCELIRVRAGSLESIIFQFCCNVIYLTLNNENVLMY